LLAPVPAPAPAPAPAEKTAIASQSQSQPHTRSIYTQDYLAGMPCRRFAMYVPANMHGGMVLRLDLAGRQHSVELPEDVRPGETVVVVAPVVA